MAKITNAFDSYSATADREALSDLIYNISPVSTPVMSAIGKKCIDGKGLNRVAQAILSTC